MGKIATKIQVLENDLFYYLEQTSIEDESYWGRCQGIELDANC